MRKGFLSFAVILSLLIPISYSFSLYEKLLFESKEEILMDRVFFMGKDFDQSFDRVVVSSLEESKALLKTAEAIELLAAALGYKLPEEITEEVKRDLVALKLERDIEALEKAFENQTGTSFRNGRFLVEIEGEKIKATISEKFSATFRILNVSYTVCKEAGELFEV